MVESGHGKNPEDAATQLLLDQEFPAEIGAIRSLSQAVEAALAFDPRLCFAINLALEELLTNTIRHGLGEAPGHKIHIRISRTADRLLVSIEDDAPPFDPFQQAPPPPLGTDLDTRRAGGLGVHLVKELMDEVRTEFLPSGNRIVLVRKLG